MSHRWQRRLPRRRSQHRRQPLRPSGLCLGPLPQRHPGRREGWLPSFLYGGDKRVCRSVHERSSSPLSFVVLLVDDSTICKRSVRAGDFREGSEGGGAKGNEPEYLSAFADVQSSRRNNSTRSVVQVAMPLPKKS